METVTVKPECNGERVQRHYLLMADCFGVGVNPKRRKELRDVRLPVIIDYPRSMSFTAALTEVLMRLSHRDFADTSEDFNDYQNYREFYIPVP